MMHTINGKIRMKRSARKAGMNLQDNEQDKGTGPWLIITSPDDLFKYDIDIDFKKLNYGPLNFVK